MRSFFLFLFIVASGLLGAEVVVWVAVMIFRLFGGRYPQFADSNLTTLTLITVAMEIIAVVGFLLSPRTRLGVGPKGTIKRLRSRKKFHASWKDLFDHH